jgi:hypothetical protein
MVPALLATVPVQFGKPVFQLASPRMPTEWWLRPVKSAARVGEQSAVVWKFV